MSDEKRLDEIRERMHRVWEHGFVATCVREVDLYQLGVVDAAWLLHRIAALTAALDTATRGQAAAKWERDALRVQVAELRTAADEMANACAAMIEKVSVVRTGGGHGTATVPLRRWQRMLEAEYRYRALLPPDGARATTGEG